jgi:hypothetical protein
MAKVRRLFIFLESRAGASVGCAFWVNERVGPDI